VLFYATREALRNAADHGGGGTLAQPVNVEIAVIWQEGLKIVITDDGVGLEKSIQGHVDHQPKTGKGQGLALHSTMMAVIGGSLMVESRPGQSTSIILELPAESWQFFRYP
jgi:signal transduction histidine kinase